MTDVTRRIRPPFPGHGRHPYTRRVSAPPPVVVLIPVKAFARAKSRLAASLDPTQRAQLARSMATTVVRAAAPLPVTVVCDDDDVAAWATSVGASVEMTPGGGLNGAVTEAVDRLRARGVARVVIAHGDLPFARSFERFAPGAPDDLAPRPANGVVIVPDRRRSGTNVLSVPTDSGFRFAYGTDSLDLHLAEADRLGLPTEVWSLDDLGWDVDEPEDLDVPEHLGRLDPTGLSEPPESPDPGAGAPGADPSPAVDPPPRAQPSPNDRRSTR